MKHLKLFEAYKLDNNGVLDVSYHELTSLPELPKSLLYLNCGANNIKYLPEFPDNLKDFYCYGNPLECIIPTKFVLRQDEKWLIENYFPYINSYAGQLNILTRQPHMVNDLIEQTRNNIYTEIKNKFPHLFTGNDLNLL